MSSMRDIDQADWDLERCFNMFDEALTSKDERVINALRNLLMIVALTAPETGQSLYTDRTGPLRRITNDHNDLVRKVGYMESELRQLKESLNMQYDLRHSSANTSTNWPYSGLSIQEVAQVNAMAVQIAQEDTSIKSIYDLKNDNKD